MNAVLERETLTVNRNMDLSGLRKRFIKRGEIWYADLSGAYGMEQNGVRPIYVFSNNFGNKFGSTVHVAAITASSMKLNEKPLPTHVYLSSRKINGLDRDSVILFEQIRTLDKVRLSDRIAILDQEHIEEADRALAVAVGLLSSF